MQVYYVTTCMHLRCHATCTQAQPVADLGRGGGGGGGGGGWGV